MKSEKLDSTIVAFGNILTELNKGGNLVIGGTHALLLHGLKVPRDPNDLDIVIYRPTSDQCKLLLALKDVTVGSENGCQDPTAEQGVTRSFKLRSKNSLEIDFLLQRRDLPDGLLTYENRPKGIKLRVQSIEGVLAAKASYRRCKDIHDLFQLKNINFNHIM